MNFAVLHTADWQLGKPFGRFDAGKAAILRRAREEAIDRLADEARRSGASHILVAGDVFDSETLPDQLLRQTMRRLAAAPDLAWHLLPGNHDPAHPGGVWDRLQTAGVPPNAHLHLAAGVTEIAPGVQLLTAPLHARATTNDPTAWMDGAATPAGHVRIGMAHGSVQGFGGLGEAAVPIDPARPKRAGLAYLALGDWHGVKEIGPSLWYSGTPEPDSFTENEPGHALVVRVGGAAAPPRVETVPTAAFHWLSRRCDVSRASDLDRLLQEIAAAPQAVGSWLLDITVRGRLPPQEIAGLEQRLRTLGDGLFDLRVDRQELTLRASVEDIAGLGDEGTRRVGESILRRASDPDPDVARRAGLALELLFAIDAEVSEGGRS